MATPLRPRAIPQCSACLRSYAFGSFAEPGAATLGSTQQIRGKKKVVITSTTVPVRLLKDVKTFGRKGTIVPIAMGRMRNEWFPRRVAEYVTLPEKRTLRLKNVAVERDFNFGVADLAQNSSAASQTGEANQLGQRTTPTDAARVQTLGRRAPEVQRVTPERSMQLLEIFVPKRLDFYRQPIAEEPKEAEPEPEQKKPERNPRSAFGAAADLLAARQPLASVSSGPLPPAPKKGSQGIYGSVTTQDVLVAIRAAMANNDESARVLIAESDIKFTETGSQEADETGKVKHVGEFVAEIKIKGAEDAIKRTIRIHAQDL